MKRFSLLLMAFAAWTPLSGAPCALAPLSTYTTAGYTCEVGPATFSAFSFQLQNGGGGNLLDETTIMVSPLSQANAIGLQFSGAFQSTGGPDAVGPAAGIRVNAYRFFFDVTGNGVIFTSVISRLNEPFRFAPNVLKFGDIFAANLAANDAALAIAHDDDPDLTDADALNTNRVLIKSDNLIQLAAGASAAGTSTPVGFASLESADFLYTYEIVVPEPGAWALSVLGLGVLAALRSRRRQ